MIQLDNNEGMTAMITERFFATANADGTWRITAPDVPMRLEDNVYIRGDLVIPKAVVQLTALPDGDGPDDTIWALEVTI